MESVAHVHRAEMCMMFEVIFLGGERKGGHRQRVSCARTGKQLEVVRVGARLDHD